MLLISQQRYWRLFGVLPHYRRWRIVVMEVVAAYTSVEAGAESITTVENKYKSAKQFKERVIIIGCDVINTGRGNRWSVRGISR